MDTNETVELERLRQEVQRLHEENQRLSQENQRLHQEDNLKRRAENVAWVGPPRRVLSVKSDVKEEPVLPGLPVRPPRAGKRSRADNLCLFAAGGRST